MRLIWYKVQNIALNIVQKEMLNKEYKSGSRSGFRIQDCRRSQIIGRYIVSDIIVDRIIDPFGETHEYQREIFEETCFRINSEFPELELINPPRRQNAFLSAFSVASRFQVSIEPVQIHLKRFIDFFSEMNIDSIAKEIVIKGAKTEGAVTYKLHIKSDEDARKTAAEIKFIQKPVWEALSFVSKIYGRQFSFIVNNRGRIIVKGKNEEEITEILRTGIQKSVLN
jgi:hypothetical protein